MRLARNIAIIAAIAAAVAFLPGGGNGAEAVVTTISIAFLAAIGFAAFTLYRQQRETIWTIDDTRRAVLLGSVGVIVLAIAGADEAFDSGGGTLLWLLAVGGAIAAIVAVWRQATSYT